MKSYIFEVLCILLVKYSKEAEVANCTDKYTGVSNTTDIGTNSMPLVSGNETEMVYMIEDPVSCCGVIEGWEAYVKDNGTIYFDIWRPTNGTFMLVGTHNLTTAQSVNKVNVSVADRYTIYPGDRIGWYTPSEKMVAYIPGNSSAEANRVTFFKLPLELHILGKGLNWSMDVLNSSNTYAIKAIYGINKRPKFVNQDYLIEILPHTANGTVIYTINATDPDISDTTITQLTYNMTSPTEVLSFDPGTREVKVTADVATSFKNQCLTFEVEDICNNKDTKSLCFFMDILPPTVSCKPENATIIETSAGNVASTTLVVSDPTNYVTCSLPTNEHFHLRLENNEYKIYVDANPGFRVATQDSYNVSVTCTNIRKSSTANCTIQILPSAPPVFTNLPRNLTLSRATVMSELVYHVSVTDNDSKSFNFSMSCRPSSCPFTLYNTGYIQLNRYIIDLNASNYELNITVTDGYNIRSSILTVNISGVNVSPTILSLPLEELQVPENTALGLIVYRVNATDSDGDPLTYTMTASPTTGYKYFSIDSNSGFITTSTVNSIDFETISDRDFTFTVFVTDGRLFVSKNISINVTDVNERPSFNQSIYRINANESMANTALHSPGFYVHDVDVGDTHTFKHECFPDNSYFTMNVTNGILKFAVDYDLDIPGTPRLITCNVKATDSGNLTATATLLITLNEINDNTPIFNNLSYTFAIYNDSALGLVIGHISATDADIGTNGQFAYSTNQTGLAQIYFGVSPTGHVTLQRSLNREQVGKTLSFIVYATDDGSPVRVGSATVTVSVMEPTTTTAGTTTNSYRTFVEDKRNIVWIVFLALFVLLTTLLTVWICWSSVINWPIGFYPFHECARNCSRPRWCKDCCKDSGKGSNKPRPVFNRPKQPQPAKPSNQLSSTPMQLSVTPQMSPDITLPFTFTPSQASHSQRRPQASRSPMRPEDDPNYREYNFWGEKWY